MIKNHNQGWLKLELLVGRGRRRVDLAELVHRLDGGDRLLDDGDGHDLQRGLELADGGGRQRGRRVERDDHAELALGQVQTLRTAEKREWAQPKIGPSESSRERSLQGRGGGRLLVAQGGASGM